ncbi:MAG: carboxypeptidase-like regulatory domain-containing protein [Candidatus Cryptobacteroides sp.]
MKKIILTVLVILIAMTSFAQTAVKGYVECQGTSEPLIGASLIESGTTYGTITSLDGDFSLSLNEGKHDIDISYIGFVTARISLRISRNGTEILSSENGSASLEDGILKIHLREDANFLASSTVTGRKSLESLQALQNERVSSSFAIENLGSKEMSIKGLSDARESVSKLSGISFADAGQLIVRGLGDRYSTTTLNGLPIASPNPDNKLIPLDIFPSTTIQNVTVTKVYEVSTFADYSGAHIDISTKNTSSDYLAFSVGSGGLFGTIFAQAYSMISPSLLSSYNLDRKAENLPYSDFPAYNKSKDIFSKTPFTVKNRKAMPNLNLTAGWGKVFKVKGQELSVTANVSSRYSERIVRDAYFDTYEASGMRKSNFNYDSYSQNEDIAALLNLEQTLRMSDALALTAFFARNATRSFQTKTGTDYEDRDLFGESQADHRYMLTDLQFTGTHELGRWNIDWGVSASITSSDEPDRRQMLFQEGSDGMLHFFTNNLETYRYFGKLREKEYTADFKSTFHIDETSRLRFGITAKDKTRAFSTTRFLYDVSSLTETFGHGVEIDIEPLVGFEAQKNNGVTMQRKQNQRDRYEASNLVGAMFLEYDKSFDDRWFLNAGVRFEAGRCQVDYNDDVENTTRILDSYDPFFALNLKYKFWGCNFIRLSASRTITRASFIEMAPFLYQESYGGVMLRGNASLKNAYNYNIDLRWEYISDSSTDLFSVTGYFKRLENPIERIQRYSGGAPEHSFSNAKNGVAAGIEAEIRKEIAKGLTVSANGTYMYTNVKLPEGGVYTNSERGLQGASPYLVNADVVYAPEFRNGSRLSLALLYNLQGPRIHSVGLSGLGDVKQMPFHSLDFNAVWSFNTRLSLNLGFKNILCSKTRFRQDVPQTGETVDIEGWDEGAGFSIGINWKL